MLLLSKTSITTRTEKLINIKGFTVHTTNRKDSKGWGTAVLVKNGIAHKRKKDLKVMSEKEAESTFIEMIAKNGKKIVIRSLYGAPNMKEDTFVNYVEKTIKKIKCEIGQKEIIMGMAHNLNLLKANQHKGTRHLLDMMLESEMIPTITRPTRIMNNTATLIDYVFIGGKIQ